MMKKPGRDSVYGYTGNLLRVDLTTGRIATEKLDPVVSVSTWAAPDSASGYFMMRYPPQPSGLTLTTVSSSPPVPSTAPR